MESIPTNLKLFPLPLITKKSVSKNTLLILQSYKICDSLLPWFLSVTVKSHWSLPLFNKWGYFCKNTYYTHKSPQISGYHKFIISLIRSLNSLQIRLKEYKLSSYFPNKKKLFLELISSFSKLINICYFIFSYIPLSSFCHFSISFVYYSSIHSSYSFFIVLILTSE